MIFSMLENLPWGEIAGGGAAIAVLGAIFLFLRHLTESRKESHDTVRKAHETICVVTDKHAQAHERFALAIENFAVVNRSIAEKFGETAIGIQKEANQANASMLHDAREAHAKCEETIHNLLRDSGRKP